MFNFKKLIPGLRIIKTLIAVSICMLLFYAIGYYKPLYATIACVLMLKENSVETRRYGINRILGTLIGGIVSLLIIKILIYADIGNESYLFLILMIFALYLVLIINKIFNFDTYVGSISTVLALIMLMNYNANTHDAFRYVLIRVLETFVGIIIAYFTNVYINPKRINKHI